MCDSCAELAGPPSALRANQILDGIQDRGVRKAEEEKEEKLGDGFSPPRLSVAEFDLLFSTYCHFFFSSFFCVYVAGGMATTECSGSGYLAKGAPLVQIHQPLAIQLFGHGQHWPGVGKLWPGGSMWPVKPK